ncbi:MAG: stage V sporulation protein S [Candidatus Hydrogenedentota bacterium]
MEILLKVSAKSNPNSVAGAMAISLRKGEKVNVQVIGAGALNQAIKAIIITRGFLAPNGLDVICRPAFIDLMVDEKERTAIKLQIETK